MLKIYGKGARLSQELNLLQRLSFLWDIFATKYQLKINAQIRMDG